MRLPLLTTFLLSAFLFHLAGISAADDKPLPTLSRSIDLNIGESQEVTLSNGKQTTIKLIDLQESRDSVRNAVRVALVKVEIDGQPLELISANYQLPKTLG